MAHDLVGGLPPRAAPARLGRRIDVSWRVHRSHPLAGHHRAVRQDAGDGELRHPCARHFIPGANPAVRAANCARRWLPPAWRPAAFDTRQHDGSARAVGQPGRQSRPGQREAPNPGRSASSSSRSAWPNFRMAVDWTDIRLEGGIRPIGIGGACRLLRQQHVSERACAASARSTAADIAALPPQLSRAPGGRSRQRFRTDLRQPSTVDFEGLIVSAESAIRYGAGRTASFGTKVFYTAKFEETVFAGDEPVDQAGLARHAGIGCDSTWTIGGTGWTSTGRRSGRAPSSVGIAQYDRDCSRQSHPPPTLHDCTLAIDSATSSACSGRRDNVIDKEIPFKALPGGFSGYDPIGRRYFLTVRAILIRELLRSHDRSSRWIRAAHRSPDCQWRQRHCWSVVGSRRRFRSGRRKRSASTRSSRACSSATWRAARCASRGSDRKLTRIAGTTSATSARSRTSSSYAATCASWRRFDFEQLDATGTAQLSTVRAQRRARHCEGSSGGTDSYLVTQMGGIHRRVATHAAERAIRSPTAPMRRPTSRASSASSR